MVVSSQRKQVKYYSHTHKKPFSASAEKKLKEASGEAIQKDIRPPRMVGCKVGAVVEKKKQREKGRVSKKI